MAKSNSFNIADLYQKAFGVTGVRFAIPDASAVSGIGRSLAATAQFAGGQRLNSLIRSANAFKSNGFDDSQIEILPLPSTSITSVLGTPIFEQITLAIPAIVKNGAVVSQQSTYTFPGWPLFDITGQNAIVKTQMQGKKGSVKEFIYEGDYAITIRGFLINDDENSFPEDQFQELAQVLNAKVTLGITSQVFNLLDIHNVVIEHWNFPAVEGFQNMQPFVLECLSDEPVELVIKDVKTRKPIVAGL